MRQSASSATTALTSEKRPFARFRHRFNKASHAKSCRHGAQTCTLLLTDNRIDGGICRSVCANKLLLVPSPKGILHKPHLYQSQNTAHVHAKRLCKVQGDVACKVYLGGLKGDASLLLQAQHVLHQEAVCIVPGQEHIFDHSKHALLLEAQGLASHHRGVDEVQA